MAGGLGSAMERWRIAVLGLLALLASPASAEEPAIWRHGIVPLKSDAGIVMMASERGFARAQGLKLEMIQFKSDALSLKALLAGELDSYEGSPGAPIMAAARGADVKIVGCHWPGLTYGIFAKPTIASVQDLKGKLIGISNPGALADLLARAMLEKYDVPIAGVRFVMLGSDADRFQALAGGVIDAAAMSTELVPLARSQGLNFLMHSHDFVPEFLRSCIEMSGRTIARRREDAVRFLAAEMGGLRYAMAHRDEEIALAVALTQAKSDDPRPAYVFDELQRYGAIDPEIGLPMERLDWMEALLVRSGNLDRPAPTAGIVDASLRTEALARAAP
jgi:NitT/TauT family transport system substrate-binding protein